MTTLVTLLALAGATDYCAWKELPTSQPALSFSQSVRGGLVFKRHYSRLWALCALERGAEPPVLLIKARDALGTRVLHQETIELKTDLSPESKGSITERLQPCGDPTDRRAPGDVLFGPVGRKHWHRPTRITVEIVAKGALAPLAYRTSAEVHCPVCVSQRRTASLSFYQPEKGKLRFYVKVPKNRYQCARGGGAMHLRRFWIDEDHQDKWLPLKPFASLTHLEKKLRPEGDAMVYEKVTSSQASCRAGKKLIWEVVGTGEYATIVNHSGYGPSPYIRRDDIEFLRCK